MGHCYPERCILGMFSSVVCICLSLVYVLTNIITSTSSVFLLCALSITFDEIQADCEMTFAFLYIATQPLTSYL